MPRQKSAHSVSHQPIVASKFPDAPVDRELKDWDAFYSLLLAGKLTKFAGEFVVISDGKVLNHGKDPDELRRLAAAQLGVKEVELVIPFVDNQECIAVE